MSPRDHPVVSTPVAVSTKFATASAMMPVGTTALMIVMSMYRTVHIGAAENTNKSALSEVYLLLDNFILISLSSLKI
jgi:hypothetical protein